MAVFESDMSDKVLPGLLIDFSLATDYEHMMAVSQILFSQYQIWDIGMYVFGLSLKRKVFCRKKQPDSKNN